MGIPLYDNIDRLLKEKYMTRRQLAIEIGMHPGTMSTAFIRRSTMFRPQTLEKIADALGVTPEELKAPHVDVRPLGNGEAIAIGPIGTPFHAFSVDECNQMISEINENVLKLKPKHLYSTNEYIKERLILQQQEDAAKKKKEGE